MGRVYLTGAGPGDIELLTVKALRVIQKADVIIYDRLANREILDEAKSGCEFIYVGKEDSHHTLPQEKINEILYKSALDNILSSPPGWRPFDWKGGRRGYITQEKRGLEGFGRFNSPGDLTSG